MKTLAIAISFFSFTAVAAHTWVYKGPVGAGTAEIAVKGDKAEGNFKLFYPSGGLFLEGTCHDGLAGASTHGYDLNGQPVNLNFAAKAGTVIVCSKSWK